MANRKIKGVAGLEDAVREILTQYGDEVAKNTREVIRDVAQAGVKAIRQEAQMEFNPKNAPTNGRYYTGFAAEITEGRLKTSAVIGNKKYPGLTHLLENGHRVVVKGRQVGWAAPHPHIEPTERKINELVIKELEQRL